MNDRTIWIVRIIAVFVFLLLAYLMMDLYTKLRRMGNGRADATQTECRLPQEPRSGDIVYGPGVSPGVCCSRSESERS